MIADEVWQPIPGASLYEASSRGRVRSWNASYNLGWLAAERVVRRRKTPLILAQLRRADGYLQLKITDDEGACRTRKVHGLVLRAFLGEPPDETWTASHMDGDPANNAVTNLSWEPLAMTVKRQVPGTRVGNRRRGEAHHSTPLSTDDVRAIRASYRPGVRGHGSQAIAKRYGISKQAVRMILARKTWRHVDDHDGKAESSGHATTVRET